MESTIMQTTTAVPTAHQTRPLLSVQKIHKSFGRQEILRNVSLDVNAGDVTCIIGPSGSGKSTLLRCINHLERVDYGRIYLDGKLLGYREFPTKLVEMKTAETARQRRGVGMVFQSFNLFP